MISNYKRIGDFGLVGGFGRGGSKTRITKDTPVSYSLTKARPKEYKTETIEEFKARGGKLNKNNGATKPIKLPGQVIEIRIDQGIEAPIPHWEKVFKPGRVA